MKFGAFVPQGWRLDLVDIEPGYPQYQAMLGCARRAEAAGYDSLWLYDHFHTVPDTLTEACFEVWTATAALAQATSRIRLGQMCGCNIYRPPALLAKVAANIDVISNGRLEFGLGAGWYEHEAVAYGYAFDKPAQRIGRLDEAVQIVKGMWTHDHFQFDGQYYQIGRGRVRNYRGQEEELKGAMNHPKPVQKPHPPMWIAGGGEQLTLKTVARYANYSNFMGPLEFLQRKNQILDEHCLKVGRDPKQIVRTTSINLMLGSDGEIDSFLSGLKRSPQDQAGLKSMLFPGQVSQVIDRIAELHEKARIDYVLVYFIDAVKGESLERFAREVIPALAPG